jgi:predicted DNA-binding transcriptional regulator AlpA
MSKGRWKNRACRQPLIPSSSIPEGEWFSQANILGTPQYDIPPMFAMSRDQLEFAIEQGLFPKPAGRVLGYGGRGPLIWQSNVIKKFIEDLEAGRAAAPPLVNLPVHIPEGWTSTGELVKLLGVSRQTVHTWTREGRIPRPARFGGRPAWSPDQVRAMSERSGL